MELSDALYRVMHKHRSIRRYRSTPIPDAMLERILAASVRTSSSGNMQAYSIIVTTSPEKRQALHPLHFSQDQVLEAPAFVTFCADFHRMRRWLSLREAPLNFDNPMSFLIGAIDAILVSQSFALAAEAEGLGICYLGTTLASCREMISVLELPENVFPVVGFTLGFPAEEPPERDRLPLEGLVHRETYHQASDEDLLAIYGEREKRGFARYMADAGLRRRVEECGATNLAQIYTKAKYTRESHLRYSQSVMTALREQNFARTD